MKTAYHADRPSLRTVARMVAASLGGERPERSVECGLLELEVLSVLSPGKSHSVRDLADLSGLPPRAIREIEKSALSKIRRAPEFIRVLSEHTGRSLPETRGAA